MFVIGNAITSKKECKLFAPQLQTAAHGTLKAWVQANDVGASPPPVPGEEPVQVAAAPAGVPATAAAATVKADQVVGGVPKKEKRKWFIKKKGKNKDAPDPAASQDGSVVAGTAVPGGADVGTAGGAAAAAPQPLARLEGKEEFATAPFGYNQMGLSEESLTKLIAACVGPEVGGEAALTNAETAKAAGKLRFLCIKLPHLSDHQARNKDSQRFVHPSSHTHTPQKTQLQLSKRSSGYPGRNRRVGSLRRQPAVVPYC